MSNGTSLASCDVMDTPVPEPKWAWRRAMVYGVMLFNAVLLALVTLALDRQHDEAGLRLVAMLLVGEQLVALITYLIAPTAEYVHQIAQVVAAARSGAQPPAESRT